MKSYILNRILDVLKLMTYVYPSISQNYISIKEMRLKMVPEILSDGRYVSCLHTPFWNLWTMWIYCSWEEIVQECISNGSAFMQLLKTQPGKWHSKPPHKSFIQQVSGIYFLKWKPLTCPWSLILYENLSIPNASLVSLTVTHLSDNTYTWVHPSLCLRPSEAIKKVQSTRADWHFTFPGAMVFSVPGGGFSPSWEHFFIEWPQLIQEQEVSVSCSSVSDEK